MSKLVMVISDREEGESFALKKAKNIASPLNADIEVVRFLPQTSSSANTQSATQSIGELVGSVFTELQGVSSQVVATDNIPGWLAGHCASGDSDLVVKTAHHSESLFHTPTDWALIRQLHCPLFISANRKWKSAAKVLIALDLSSTEAEHQALNRQALSWGKQWQALFDCELHAVYSIPIAAPLLALDIVDKEDIRRSHESDAREALCTFLSDNSMGEVSAHILAGAPSKTIPHLANEIKADLVIMGSVGRGGVQGFVRGNTAEKVLHHLRTDILVVKPTGVQA